MITTLIMSHCTALHCPAQPPGFGVTIHSVKSSVSPLSSLLSPLSSPTHLMEETNNSYKVQISQTVAPAAPNNTILPKTY